LRIRHAHYLLCHSIGFLLKRISWLIDGEFALQCATGQKSLHTLIAVHGLETDDLAFRRSCVPSRQGRRSRRSPALLLVLPVAAFN